MSTSMTATYHYRSGRAVGGSRRCCGRVAATYHTALQPAPGMIASAPRARPQHDRGSTCNAAATDAQAHTQQQHISQPVTAHCVGVLVPRRQALRLLAAAMAAACSGGFVLPPAADAEELANTAARGAAAAPGAVLAPSAPATAEAGVSSAPPAEAATPAEVVACFVSPGGANDSAELPPGAERAARFSSLVEAVAACPDGGVVLVAGGRYRERLVLRGQAVTIKAWPQGAEVELLWETAQPYESTVDISGGTSVALGGSGGQVVLEGLTIRHASKSVANNFGVYVHGACSPRLLDCDISSRTGAGVGVEGASPWLLGCRVHDCARQGLAIFGGGAELMADLNLDLSLDPAVDPGLLTGMTGGVVQGCDVYGNALDGVLVRGGAAPDLMDNKVHDNKGSGFNLQDCSGRYSGNVVYDNARGAVAVSPLFELDSGDLAGSNSLRGLLRRL